MHYSSSGFVIMFSVAILVACDSTEQREKTKKEIKNIKHAMQITPTEFQAVEAVD